MSAINDFFARYPASVSALAAAVRDVVRSVLPDASETIDEPSRIVGYGVGPAYSGLVCTIIPSKSGVKLGIVRGAELSDRYGLLQGGGKRHRYIQFNQVADVHHAGVVELLNAARDLALSRSGRMIDEFAGER